MPHVALQMALEFHETMGQAIGDPRHPNINVDQDLRVELIREEFEELKLALAAGDVVEVADALADLQYVINGAAATWGIDLASVYEEVHNSNMTKAAESVDATNDRKMSGQKRADGKVMKGPNYRPPDVAGVLKEVALLCEQDGFGEDGFWPEPTVKWDDDKPTPALKALFEEPPPVSRELKTAMAMKSIDHAASFHMGHGDFGKNQMPAEMTESLSLKGTFTNYGAFVFDCKCGRTHATQARMGSRGGMALKATVECMCGYAYTIRFPSGHIEQTTIEELRKVTQ